ncbi:acetate--CoA ligase alpha subunit [Methanotorris igneus]|uniref:acetate--CoA ligase (ADP-forming) n=1 Tax=Methanotorris igneus (strain DSM 5666 / JCM 11834 / Kol 5) TaxID=880724 RepID=F6BDD3_METIK|nr:acetate--CoA ligase family protein [Methanotorris igneus]AEF96494.1 acetyl coenzyme A synthetase (ADP forming), alpha domain protein [Methanotorris igneus Kol 5]
MKNFDAIFNPKSIAIIGASKTEGKVGYSIMKNLMSFDGKLYPVNPKYDEISGLKCYKSVLDIDDEIDLAIVVVPAQAVPKVMEECGEKGVKGAVIISAGFSEVGNYELEEEVKKIIKKYNIATIGPNCLGIMNTYRNLNTTFGKLFPNKGNISIISQSGAVLTAILDISPLLNLGFSKIVSIGNKIDVQESDLMEYLMTDETTEVVVLYIEGLKDKRFLSVAKKLSKVKPIIALKSGRTEEGAKAASSHTGSLAGSDEIYSAAFREGGILRADTFEELVNLMHIFSTQPLMKFNEIGIVTNAGGFGVMAADMCKKYGVKLANFEEKTKEKLKEKLPKTATISNPLDIIGDADTERYKNAVSTLMEDKNVSGLLVILTPQEMTKPLEVAEEIVKLKEYYRENGIKKPIVTSFVGGASIKGAKSYLRKNGIPSYITPEAGIEALSYLYKYSKMKTKEDWDEYLEKIRKEFEEIKDNNKETIEKLFTNLNEYTAKKFLKLHGIPVPKGYIAKNKEEAIRYAKELGSRLVMKIVSPDILHKSDAGCVIINPQDVGKAYETIINNAKRYFEDHGIDGVIEGVLIEEFVDGLEIIVGGKRDEIFGPVVMTGLGGVFVEVLKDVSFGIYPITKEYAHEMLKELKSYKILEGVRGRPKRDIKSIVDLIVKLGVMMELYDEIKEIDMNPVFVKEDGKGCCVGDALIILKK